jgi:oligosaccharyltransferase complex subunit alpha (ribophorin I)
MRFTNLAAATLLAIGTYADANASQATHQVTSAFQPPQHWQNNNLVRSINLEKSYPREYVNVVIENISPSPQDEYYIPIQGDLVGKVGSLEVKDKKAAGQAPFVVELLGNDAYRYATER